MREDIARNAARKYASAKKSRWTAKNMVRKIISTGIERFFRETASGKRFKGSIRENVETTWSTFRECTYLSPYKRKLLTIKDPSNQNFTMAIDDML